MTQEDWPKGVPKPESRKLARVARRGLYYWLAVAVSVLVLAIAALTILSSTLSIQGSDLPTWVLGLIGIWGVIVGALGYSVPRLQRPSEAESPPKLSGVHAFDTRALFSYYLGQRPVLATEETAVSQSLLSEFSDKPLHPDSIILVPNPERYKLSTELLPLADVVKEELERTKPRFEAEDEIGIVTRITGFDGAKVKVDVQRARMLDEYATIQNPDMDLHTLAPIPATQMVSSRSVRAFFGPRLPTLMDTWGDMIGKWPAVRVASHVILLLVTDPATKWEDRIFLLQLRPERDVATGAGETTSSMGGGLDWADVASRKARRKLRRSGHGLFTNYVLREIGAEILVSPDEVVRLSVVAITRDLERLGQPVFILLGETSLTYENIRDRWNHARSMAYRSRGLGKEHWEAQRLLPFRIAQIDDLLNDANVQSSTKSCLVYLRRIDRERWKQVPLLNGAKPSPEL